MQPVLQVKFTSRSATGDDLKENRVTVVATGVTLCYTPELSWLDELGAFVKPPPGVFEGVVPAERSKIRLTLNDVSLHLAPTEQRNRAVVHLPLLTFATDLVPDTPTAQSHIELKDIRVLLTDDEINAASTAARSTALAYWASRGFVEVALLRSCAVAIRRGNGSVLPDLDVHERSKDIADCRRSQSSSPI